MEENLPVTSGKKCSVRKEANVVSGMRATIVRKNPDDNAATLSEPINDTRSKCVEEENYPRLKQPWCHSATTM